MRQAEPLLDYGVLGIFCFLLISALIAVFWIWFKMNKAYIQELKADRESRMELMQHLISNNNRLIENNNEMMKGFIDIVSSFKALLNVVLSREQREGL